MSGGTYEDTKAKQSTTSLPDPIHWSKSTAFRDSPYRQLHHQHGIVGEFSVRLLEAKDLRRRHWSALALGPAKYLGLSRAHGEVTSFATLGLAFRSHAVCESAGGDGGGALPEQHVEFPSGSVAMAMAAAAERRDYKDLTRSSSASSLSSCASDSPYASPLSSPARPPAYAKIQKQKEARKYTYRAKDTFRSTTMPSNDNPIWPTAQSSTNVSLFTIPVRKGSMPIDGMSVLLQVKLEEEMSAVDIFVPGGFGRGGGHDDNDNDNDDHSTEHTKRRSGHRGGGTTLGRGTIDLTSLLLGNDGYTNQALSKVDVWDVWIDLTLPADTAAAVPTGLHKQDGALPFTQQTSTGKVRLLISYEPNGLCPRRGDVVALEAFARRPINISSCTPILPPLEPLRVEDVKGSYVLVSFDMTSTTLSPVIYTGTNRGKRNEEDEEVRRRRKNQQQSRYKKGTLRLHRNALFVIERTNLLDSALNAALFPADFILSTPLGQETSRAATPYVEAAGDVVMPAILSARLVLEAAKVGASAGFMGLKAAMNTVVANQDANFKKRTRRHTHAE